jgi:hypothetical protein
MVIFVINLAFMLCGKLEQESYIFYFNTQDQYIKGAIYILQTNFEINVLLLFRNNLKSMFFYEDSRRLV